MLGDYWLIIAISLFIASLALRQVPLLLLSLLFFLASGAARLWGRYCLERVEYRRKLSSNRVFFGEEVQLDVEVANRKPLPLPWIQIDDEMPIEVTFLKGKLSPSHKVTRVVLTNLLPLSWYHKVKRRYHLRCGQRGYFSLGPASIHSGDIFGFFRREMQTEQADHLMVYPKIVPLEKLGIPSKQPVGDIRPKSHIFHDPILTQGVREYHFGDSLKRIHWKTTARLGQLQTKVFEPTTTIDMGIFLDVRTTKPPYWGTIPELHELAIVVAASLSNHALAEGYRVGLYINQNRWFSDQLIRMPPSQHTDQLLHILETLAQIHPFETMPIARLVQNESKNLQWESTLVVITAAPTDDLLATMSNMKRAGRRVALITIGGPETAPSNNGLAVYHVRDDVPWRQLETLSIGGKQ
ncbi:MAG: DUF58 domain-containing protein [Chloroflexi bacterium]|nr:DUF58 domain-containing protein [Chloroflexota bacterium]